MQGQEGEIEKMNPPPRKRRFW